jgi:hypothetical protein
MEWRIFWMVWSTHTWADLGLASLSGWLSIYSIQRRDQYSVQPGYFRWFWQVHWWKLTFCGLGISDKCWFTIYTHYCIIYWHLQMDCPMVPLRLNFGPISATSPLSETFPTKF